MSELSSAVATRTPFVSSYAVTNDLCMKSKDGGALERSIPFIRVDHKSATGLFVIPPFGGSIWEPKGNSLMHRSIAEGHDFVTFGYSGLDLAARHYDNLCVRRWVDDAKVIFESLTDKPQVIVASSFGATAALKLAQLYPERIKGMVLVAPGTKLDEHLIEPYLALGEKRNARSRYEEAGTFYAPVAYHPEEGRVSFKAILLHKSNIEESRQEEIGNGPIRVPFPVVAIHDRGDRQVWLHATEELCQRIEVQLPGAPNRHRPARLIVTEGAGHDYYDQVHQGVIWNTVAPLLRSGL